MNGQDLVYFPAPCYYLLKIVKPALLRKAYTGIRWANG